MKIDNKKAHETNKLKKGGFFNPLIQKKVQEIQRKNKKSFAYFKSGMLSYIRYSWLRAAFERRPDKK